VEPLRTALAPLAERIAAAFVFGSVAKGNDRAGSDIDLLVVSDHLSYQEVYPALETAEAALARRIDPTVLTRAEWKRKAARDDSFAARILDQPKLFVIGSADALA
jgi:predicted nucleotidyltransferase